MDAKLDENIQAALWIAATDGRVKHGEIKLTAKEEKAFRAGGAALGITDLDAWLNDTVAKQNGLDSVTIVRA